MAFHSYDLLEGTDGRPAPLRWLSRMGMRLIVYFAEGGGGLAANKPPECAEHMGPVKCCFLACPETECPYDGSRDNFTCPEGYTKTAWTCCDGSTLIGCGECSGDTCVEGPFYCSIWFEAGTC